MGNLTRSLFTDHAVNKGFSDSSKRLSNTDKYAFYSEYDSKILFTGLECCNDSHYMMRM